MELPGLKFWHKRRFGRPREVIDMKRIAFLVLIAGFLNGCLSPPPLEVAGYTPPGQSAVQVGTVTVSRLLKYSGKIVPVHLAVLADENGSTILLTKAEEKGELSIYLAEDARQALLANLYKTRNLGAETEMVSADSEANVGTVVSSLIPNVQNSIRVSYTIREFGQSWACLLDLSGYDRDTILTAHMGIPSGRRDMSLLLSPDALNELLDLVEQAPNFSPKASMIEE